MMTLEVWCQTDVGLRRENNQDSYLFDEEIRLYMVADGMGGHRGGEVASRMAVETCHEVIRNAYKDAGARRLNPRALLGMAYEEASHRIYDRSQEPGTDLHGMGTTLVAALFQDGTLYIGNVGDSRAYLFSDRKLWQLTEDHSWVNEQLRAGLIAESELTRGAPKNVITRSVGFERDVQVDIIERQLNEGELVLICSDGLSGLVPDERIAELCIAHKPLELVSNCINEAKRNGGDDNVTVMAIYARPQSAD
jgi:serine/threonine protein phosphatase PrpC